MSSVIKVNKSQLATATSDIKTKVQNLNNIMNDLSGTLGSVHGHSDFSSLIAKASMLLSNFKNIYSDYDVLSTNMETYVNCLTEIDAEGIDQVGNTGVEQVTDVTGVEQGVEQGADSSGKDTNKSDKYSDDFSGIKSYSGANSILNNSGSSGGNRTYSYSTGPSGTVVYTNNFSSNLLTSDDFEVAPGGKYNYKGIEEHLENLEGVTVNVPSGLGSVHTYMGWQCITAPDSRQYKLREAAGMNFDEEGFAKIGDRYVVAVTTTFGNVGDYIDVYKEDGTVLKCIIGDIKSQKDAGCTEWGHKNGTNVVEFVVDKNSWYGSRMHSNPGTSNCHPEWNQNITKIVNKGNYFDLIKQDFAKLEEDTSTDAESSSKIVTL